jgi:hypothetical protein
LLHGILPEVQAGAEVQLESAKATKADAPITNPPARAANVMSCFFMIMIKLLFN